MKTLPIVFPPVETYQAVSFVLAVMMAHKNVSNSLYNKYIRIHGRNEEEIEDILLNFDDVLWAEYAADGLAELNLYHIKNLSKERFAPFLRERIDQNCYICLYHVDDYYLSHTPSYNRTHFSHDLYIYGYTENEFSVIAYKGMNLAMFNIPQEEVVDAVFLQEDENDKNIVTMRIVDNIEVPIDYKQIKRDIETYYNGGPQGSDKMKYGIETYDLIRKALLLNEKLEVEELDPRVFRMLWEHKKLMTMRVKKIEEDKGISGLCDICEKIEKQAYVLFTRVMKYWTSPSEQLRLQIVSRLDDLKNVDLEFGSRLLEVLD